MGGRDLPGDPCMSPLVPVHAGECVCVCACVYSTESQLFIHASTVYFSLQDQGGNGAPLHEQQHVRRRAAQAPATPTYPQPVPAN